MRNIEIRRHAERDKPHEALTAEGDAAAQRGGASLGPFELVVSSPLERALRTVRAMGQRVKRIDRLWASLGEEVEREARWPSDFGAYASAIARSGAAAALASRLTRAVFSLAAELREEGRCLIITHGGFPELVGCAFAAAPGELTSEGHVGYLEGVRIDLAEVGVPAVRVLRIPGSRVG